MLDSDDDKRGPVSREWMYVAANVIVGLLAAFFLWLLIAAVMDGGAR